MKKWSKKKKKGSGTFLNHWAVSPVVKIPHSQCRGCCGSIPGLGTEIPHAVWFGKKRNKDWFREFFLLVLVSSRHFCFTFSARGAALGNTPGMDLGQTFPGAHSIQAGGRAMELCTQVQSSGKNGFWPGASELLGRAEASRRGKQWGSRRSFPVGIHAGGGRVQVSSGLLEDCFQNNLQQEGKNTIAPELERLLGGSLGKEFD